MPDENHDLQRELRELLRECTKGRVFPSANEDRRRLVSMELDSFELVTYLVAVQQRYHLDLSTAPSATVQSIDSLASLIGAAAK